MVSAACELEGSPPPPPSPPIDETLLYETLKMPGVAHHVFGLAYRPVCSSKQRGVPFSIKWVWLTYVPYKFMCIEQPKRGVPCILAWPVFPLDAFLQIIATLCTYAIIGN